MQTLRRGGLLDTGIRTSRWLGALVALALSLVAVCGCSGDEKVGAVPSGETATQVEVTPRVVGDTVRTGESSPPEGEHLAAISSGEYHTCALRHDGTPVCWGGDWNGQSSPPEGERFAAISSGLIHTCGLRHDRTVVCWGWLDFGQARPPE